MNYELVLGLEVHVELATESKLFCSCSAKFGAQPNQNICPACCGMPGMIPSTNKRAVELAVTAGVITNCKINRVSTFDRKSYYYPDLATGYQITQLYAPICVDGCVTIQTPQGEKDIRLKQIHIEEDAGKLVHDSWGVESLVDYNRLSVPLIEIVSQPDFRSAEEVVAYVNKLRSILRFAKVSDCRMEQGSMRVDVNISVREQGSDILGVRTEMKNINSIKSIVRAIEYERQRHIDALTLGTEQLVQETRRWDDVKNKSFPMRNKENAADYRYFPNADLLPIVLDEQFISEIKQTIPDMPDVWKQRLMKMGLPEYDCDIITSSKSLVDIFVDANEQCNNPKETANWIMADVMKLANRNQVDIDDMVLNGSKLGKLITLVAEGEISRQTAKTVLEAVYVDQVDPVDYCDKHNLRSMSDQSELTGIVRKVIDTNPKSVADYKGGKTKALDALLGQVMRQTRGRGNPTVIRELLLESLE